MPAGPSVSCSNLSFRLPPDEAEGRRSGIGEAGQGGQSAFARPSALRSRVALRLPGMTNREVGGLPPPFRERMRPGAQLTLGRGDGRGGVRPCRVLKPSSRPKAIPESRDPLARSAGVRRNALTTSSAVIPAKAGIQYPPERMVARKRSSPAVRRQRQGLSRYLSGVLVPGLRLRRNRDDILRPGFMSEDRFRRSCALPSTGISAPPSRRADPAPGRRDESCGGAAGRRPSPSARRRGGRCRSPCARQIRNRERPGPCGPSAGRG
ncbi:hypothetical protein SAMN05421512_106102 [Stappia indica]|uniref:Uncharacterized protein n=1 Tax=Stappia indica TaxID=538381 RepID=A0A285STY8_9HYPH|nr:hypothetical protein SAMN05421512_106102 [Stappia indica]